MKKIVVQIYEVQTPSEAEKLIALGVDNIGSVLVSEEGWQVPPIRETIRAVQAEDALSSLIPLFNRTEALYRTLDYYRPDIVHFCEELTDAAGGANTQDNLLALQGDIKDKFPEIKIMRSIPIAQPGFSERVPTLELARRFEGVSDYFLTDTLLLNTSDVQNVDQPVKGFVGITGKTCDWSMAAKLVATSRIPVILAGGIAPENVFEGIRHIRPAGIDSCTKTNAIDFEGSSVRFKKDLDKVKRLVDEARRAEQTLFPHR